MGWVGAPKVSLPPGVGNPRYATDTNMMNVGFFKKMLRLKRKRFFEERCH